MSVCHPTAGPGLVRQRLVVSVCPLILATAPVTRTLPVGLGLGVPPLTPLLRWRLASNAIPLSPWTGAAQKLHPQTATCHTPLAEPRTLGVAVYSSPSLEPGLVTDATLGPNKKLWAYLKRAPPP